MTTADRANAKGASVNEMDAQATAGVVDAMGFAPGQVVQELGWDEDADENLRQAIMDRIDGDLVDEAVEAVDSVLLWWRADDGEVTDGLVDSMTDLSDEGTIWLLLPKIGHPGAVDPSDLAEGVTTAGLALTSQVNTGSTWQAHRVVRPKGARR